MNIGVNGFYLSTPNAGLGQYSINLLSSLSKIDKENNYFVFVQEELKDLKLGSNFTIVIIKPLTIFPKTFINRYFWEEHQLGHALKKYNIDVFHGLYQSLPRGSEKVGNLVTIHDAIPWRFSFERKNRIYRWYTNRRMNLVAKRAKKIISVSETSKLDFAPVYGIKPETIEVTYESVNPSFDKVPTPEEAQDFKSKYGITRDYILYTGGLKRHKNLRMLIKSFDILVKEHGFKGDLYILGAVRQNMAISNAIYYKIEDLEKYAKLKKIGKAVKFVGFVSQDDMSKFMHLAKCFVSLSLYEGFGLPALEAMTSGTPAVLSDLGAYAEIADGAGLFVYPYGPHRIADALDSALTDNKLREKLIKKGIIRSKFFDRLKIARRIKDIYKEVYDDYKISFQP